MMRQQAYHGNVAVGLDVGTTKICAIVGKSGHIRNEIVAVGSSPSSGLRKGVVVDMDLTAGAIKRAVREAEGIAGFQIKSVHVGIAGGHIKGFNGYGAICIRGREVRENDVDRLMDSAGAVYVPVDREVLHVIPSGFTLDGSNGIKSPLGMRGKMLEANVHIVTGSVVSVQNLIRCCETAGVEVADIVLEPLASAGAVLFEDEKKTGVALIDIGGGTTDIAVYADGALRHTAVLALGGNHLTNDIAVGLGAASQEAERIKKAHGCALTGLVDENRHFEVMGAEKQMRKIAVIYLAEIIQLRCEELLGMVKKEVESISVGAGVSGVVLTGGTSLLRGIRELAGDIIGLPVRIGLPEGVAGKGLVNSPVYATGVGLVNYGLSYCGQSDFISIGIFERMKDWVSSYLNKI